MVSSQPRGTRRKWPKGGAGTSSPSKTDTHWLPQLLGLRASSPPSLSYERAEALLGRPLGKYLNMVKAAGESGTCRGWTEPSKCHAPCNSVPATWPCPDGTQSQSPCLVLADIPLPQEDGGSLPICTDTPLSDFSFSPPFPDISLRSCSIHLLSTHPPAFKDFFLPTQTHTHLLIPPPFSLSL